MKVSAAVFALLAGSLIANAVFVGVLLKRPSTAPAPAAPAPATAITSSAASPGAAPAAPATAASFPAIENWRVEDFRRLSDQLRARGLPEEVVRNVVGDVVGHHFKARRRVLGVDPQRDPSEFWKTAVTRIGAGTPEQIAARRALEREMRDVLRATLGPDYDISEEDRRRRGHGLPPETAEKLNKIIADYRELGEQARDQATSTTDVAARFALLEREKRADLERLLTPEQLLEFDLRMGAGSGLHNRLGEFAVNEAEFRALYAAQKAFEAANPNLRPRERTAQFEPEIRRVLGESRYAELLAANNRGEQQTRAFIEMRSFVVGHNLAPGIASEVLALQEQFQPQLNVVNQNPSLTAEQKTAARANVAAAARRELLRVLGPAAFEAYDQTRAGWLPPAPSTPTRAASGTP